MADSKNRRANEIRASGRRVSSNVAEIREARRLTTAALSMRLETIGQPMLANAVTKIEKEGRRVDADDLVALALALEVTPNRLLLPDTVPEHSVRPGGEPHTATTVELTEEVSTTPQAAWRWARGLAPLPERMPWGSARIAPEAHRQFVLENAPDAAAPPTFDELIELRDKLNHIWRAVKKVATAGDPADRVPVATIANFLLLMRDWERIEQSRTDGN